MALLLEIKSISYEYKVDRIPYLALDDAKSTFYSHYQKSNESNTLHYNTFLALLEVIERHGENLCCDGALTES